MQNNKGIIIQARTSSTRLPKKIVKEIDKDFTFLDLLLSRLSILKDRYKIVIATTENPEDEIILDFGRKYNIDIFRGSEENVLDRFVKCAQQYNIDTIIRICSDNPFIDIDSIIELDRQYKDEDYLSFLVNQKPSILTHYGFFAEFVSLTALIQIQKNKKSNCIEHVTNCIYSNPDNFNIKYLEKTIDNKNIRCTLDTLDDFENLKHIFNNWPNTFKNTNFNYLDLISLIEADSKLIKKMKDQIISNTK